MYWNGLVVMYRPWHQKMAPFYQRYCGDSLKYYFEPTLKYHAQGQVVLPFALWEHPDIQVAEELEWHRDPDNLIILLHDTVPFLGL